MTSLAVAIGLWVGVKAESVVLTPKVDEADVEASDLVVRQYPAAEDAEPVENDYARERYQTQKAQVRRAYEMAVAREDKRRADAKAERERLTYLARQEYARQQAAVIAVAQAEEAKRAAEELVVQSVPEPKRERIVVSRSSGEPKAAPIVFEATAYIAMCDTGCTGVTATGIDVRNTIYTQGHRIIAVDPSIIPLGSLVRVNTPSGSFSAIAADTGGHIDGHRIDILMGSKSKASSFGRQNVSIQILRKGSK